MINIEKLFNFETGKLPALEKLDNGNVPLVYGTSKNNGVEKNVNVSSHSDIFIPPLITVSYLGSAFVQETSFTTSVVDKSNIIVLVPKKKMSLNELYYYCFQINYISSYGYNYGRRVNMARLRKFEFDEYREDILVPKVKDFLREIELPDQVSYEQELVSILDVFNVTNAKSAGFDSYDSGNVPFLTNGFYNNGIQGYVEPKVNDRVFEGRNISVSAFCEAIYQRETFLARGNGGSGLIVLEPKFFLSDEEMMFYTAYINAFISWRFNYGRMVTLERMKKMKIPKIISTQN